MITPRLIGAIKDFPRNGLLAGFSGRNYADSLLEAEKWINIVKEMHNITITPVSYYQQIHKHKSIILHFTVSNEI